MTRSEIERLFAKRQEYWARRDIAALTQFHTDDGVIISPMFGTVRGSAAIEKSYRDIFTVFPDMTFIPDELLVEDNRAAQFFRAHATHASEIFGVPATHRKFEVHGVLKFDFDESGRAREERRIYDFTALLIQLGVLKARPAK